MTFQGVTLDLRGESGPVRVQIHRMPVIARERGDRYRYASPEFGAEFLEAVIRGIPQAERTGLPWSRVSRCTRCASLLGSPTSEGNFAVPIRLRALPEFDVEIAMPAFTCGQCGMIQMPPSREVDYHRTEALSDAFKQARVDPR
jgi:hypothetical protein